MFENKFATNKKFTKKVLDVVKEKRITHIEATLLVCELDGIEFSQIKSLIGSNLRDKIEAEAFEFNYLKGGNTLPI